MSERLVLAWESGATGSVAMVADASGKILVRWRGDPLDPGSFRKQLQEIGIGRKIPARRIARAVFCMAGTSLHSSSGRVQKILKKILRSAGVPAKPEIYPDVFSTMASELGQEAGVVVVAGTGSCAMAQDGHGMVRRCGGWGALLGDEGSAYAMGRDAVRAALAAEDGREGPTGLSAVLLRKLKLPSPAGLIEWISATPKKEIAALAPVVFQCARKGDVAARDILEKAAGHIANFAVFLGEWLQSLGIPNPRIILTGGLAEHHREFAASVAQALGLNRTTVARGRKGAGALKIALGAVKPPQRESKGCTLQIPGTAPLDTLPSGEIIGRIVQGDQEIPRIVLSQKARIEQAVESIVSALQKRGRIFYVGAGTSGRLAALDAAELGPTFRLSKENFQVILAGGRQAFWRAVEGAEDNVHAAPAKLRAKRLKKNDIVIGISASGTTPFVLGALQFARRVGAKTIGIACCAQPLLAKFSDLSITLPVGPEIVRGSTRMKAGTATKLILNTISTAAMIRLGKVYDRWMVDVVPGNKKLKARATGIVSAVTGWDKKSAEHILKKAGGNAKRAIVMAKKKVSRLDADRVLRSARENLRVALTGKTT